MTRTHVQFVIAASVALLCAIAVAICQTESMAMNDDHQAASGEGKGDASRLVISIEPIGIEINGRDLNVSFIADGPEVDTRRALESFIVSCMFDPSAWLEVEDATGERIMLNGIDARSRVQFSLSSSRMILMQDEPRIRIHAAFSARATRDIAKPVTFRIREDAPFQERLRTVGGFHPRLNVRPNVRWFRTIK